MVPKRVTAHSETIIDHLYSLDTDKVAEVFFPSIAVSDHYPIYFTLSSSKIVLKDKIITQFSIGAIKSLMRKGSS